MRELLQTSDIFYVTWLIFALFGAGSLLGLGMFIVYLQANEKAYKAKKEKA
jgi:hypothetical protein